MESELHARGDTARRDDAPRVDNPRAADPAFRRDLGQLFDREFADFKRFANELHATEAAKLYILEVRPALTRLRNATVRAKSFYSDKPEATLRRLAVDAAPALATLRIAPLLGNFAACFPDVRLTLTLSRTLTDPSEDGFSCCIRYGAGDWGNVLASKLADEDVVPVCAPELVAHDSNPAPDALRTLPLIHDMMPIGWTEWFATYGMAAPASTGLVCSDSAVVLQAACAGLGVALGRSHLIAPFVASGRLIVVAARQVRSPFSYWLVSSPSKSEPLVAEFGAWLSKALFSATAD